MKQFILRVLRAIIALLTDNIVVRAIRELRKVIKAQAAEKGLNTPLVRRTEPLTIKDLWGRYLKTNPRLKAWMVVSLVLALAWIPMVILPDYDDYNAAADARGQLAQRFRLEGTSPSDRPAVRKALARSLLNLREVGLSSTLDEAGKEGFEAEVLEQIKHTRQTGEMPRFDTAHKWPDGMTAFGFNYLLALPLAVVTLYGLRYADRCKLQRERVIDLPWKRGWPFLFIVLSPVLIPIMAVSLIRLLLHKETSPAAVKKEQTYNFPSNIEGARKSYMALRSGEWRDFVKDRLTEIEKRLSELVINMERELQERNMLMGEQRKLKTASTSHNPASEIELAAEFELIRSHPAVLDLATQNGNLNVLVQARFVHEGITYDLGDWELIIRQTGFTTVEVRTGTKVDWHFWAHPIYRLPNGEFCFGATQAGITALLLENKICDAVLLAIECLCNINEKDFENLPAAFKVVDA